MMENKISIYSAHSPLADMALTRTEREREARAGREVLMSVDFTALHAAVTIGDATAGRRGGTSCG